MNTSEIKRIADRIKELRKISGFSKEEFAEILNLSLSEYSLIDKGKIKIKAQLILQITYYLKLDPYCLYSEEFSTDNSLFIKYSKIFTDNNLTSKEKIVISLFRELNNSDQISFINKLYCKSYRNTMK